VMRSLADQGMTMLVVSSWTRERTSRRVRRGKYSPHRSRSVRRTSCAGLLTLFEAARRIARLWQRCGGFDFSNLLRKTPVRRC
jgi:hypothetical protein